MKHPSSFNWNFRRPLAIFRFFGRVEDALIDIDAPPRAGNVESVGESENKLEMPDAHYLSSALGWLELGDAQSAVEELEQIAPEHQRHPHVLQVQLAISTKTARWDIAAEVADALRALEPGEANWWVSLAYATRRNHDGGLDAAKLILLKAQKEFPKEPIIPYNIACYCCRLGKADEARCFLEKAFKLGNAKELKSMALTDPDLELLWPELGKK